MKLTFKGWLRRQIYSTNPDLATLSKNILDTSWHGHTYDHLIQFIKSAGIKPYTYALLKYTKEEYDKVPHRGVSISSAGYSLSVYLDCKEHKIYPIQNGLRVKSDVLRHSVMVADFVEQDIYTGDFDYTHRKYERLDRVMEAVISLPLSYETLAVLDRVAESSGLTRVDIIQQAIKERLMFEGYKKDYKGLTSVN